MKYVVDVNGVGYEVDLDGVAATVAGIAFPATLGPVDGTPVRILHIGDRIVRVMSRRGEGRGVYTLEIDGDAYNVEAVDERTRTIRDMTAKSAAPSGPAPLKAPMPGLIVRVTVAPGDSVHVGQGLVVMEAMKMENELRATMAGTVKAVHVASGTVVEKGALLVELL